MIHENNKSNSMWRERLGSVLGLLYRTKRGAEYSAPRWYVLGWQTRSILHIPVSFQPQTSWKGSWCWFHRRRGKTAPSPPLWAWNGPARCERRDKREMWVENLFTWRVNNSLAALNDRARLYGRVPRDSKRLRRWSTSELHNHDA